MAAPDNTVLNPGTGGDNFATDGLDTVNGQAADANLKVQRIKMGFGVDGELNDVNEDQQLPVDLAQALDHLRQIAGILGVVFARTASGLRPSLHVASNNGADFNVTATVSGNAGTNIVQFNGNSPELRLPTDSPNASTGGRSIGVTQSIAYHLPIIPQHLYSQITG